MSSLGGDDTLCDDAILFPREKMLALYGTVVLYRNGVLDIEVWLWEDGGFAVFRIVVLAR